MFSTKTYKICYQFPEMLYINTLKNKMNVEFSMLHFLQDKHDLRNEFNKFLYDRRIKEIIDRKTFSSNFKCH